MMIYLPDVFKGHRVWYLAARDILETSSDWQTAGSWTVDP
jgi:hypothetical protein